MKRREAINVKADLHQYLRNNKRLSSPDSIKAFADATRFVQAAARNGFEAAYSASPVHVNVPSARPFVEVAEALADHHVRFIRETEREIVRKSLFEAYMYIAGSRYMLRPARKTRFVHSLRHSELKKFVGLLLSLYLYNLICARIEENLRKKLPDAKSVDLYLLNLEATCRDVVEGAVKSQPTEPDEQWILAVMSSAERQLLDPGTTAVQTPHLPIPSGSTK